MPATSPRSGDDLERLHHAEVLVRQDVTMLHELADEVIEIGLERERVAALPGQDERIPPERFLEFSPLISVTLNGFTWI